MSTPVLHPWLCAPISLRYGLLLLAALPRLTEGRQGNCSHPVMPEHGWFRCEPSPCRGFPQKSSVHYFCEPGFYIPSSKTRSSRCRHGKWMPSVPACVPLKDKHNMNVNQDSDRAAHSLPSVATTAVGVSIFLLTTTACMVIKSRLYPCHSHSRRSSDQMDLMVDGLLPVSLPSYEEAVYGSWGQRLSPCSAPGPTQLLLAQESPGSHQSPVGNQSDTSRRPRQPSQSPEHPPPPYEAVPSRPREERSDAGDVPRQQVTLMGHKDT